MTTMIDYAAIITPAHTITLCGEPRDYSLHLEIAIEDHATGQITTTASSENWPLFDEVFPRHRWPEPIFAGKHYEERWDVPEEFTTAIEEAVEAEVDTLIDEYDLVGEREKITKMWLTREEGIMVTRSGVDMSLREYSDLLDEMEG